MESFSAMYCVSKSLFGATSGSEDSSFLQEERKEMHAVLHKPEDRYKDKDYDRHSEGHDDVAGERKAIRYHAEQVT